MGRWVAAFVVPLLASGCVLARGIVPPGGADAGPRIDAADEIDAADPLPDADGVEDSGDPDANEADCGVDAGLPDAGPPDVGAPDVGMPDAGCPPHPVPGSPARVVINPGSDLRVTGFVRVDYSGFPGSPYDWVEVSLPCTPPFESRAWIQVPVGSMSGTVDIAIPTSVAPGTYEVRALFNGSSTIVDAISPAFTINAP